MAPPRMANVALAATLPGLAVDRHEANTHHIQNLARRGRDAS